MDSDFANVSEAARLKAELEATREILATIRDCQNNAQPVLDAITRHATLLCDAKSSGLQFVHENGEQTRLASTFSKEAAVFELGTVFELDHESHLGRAIRQNKSTYAPDLRKDSFYQEDDPDHDKMLNQIGLRSRLCVPLQRGGTAFGVLTINHTKPNAFDPDFIALAESFAAQAVIAIENVRQFKALEALNAELGDRVEEQVGEIERMGRLKRFLPAAVADTVVSSGKEDLLNSHRALLGILFCDIRGFTAFCESAEPEETIEVLQTYHEEMGKLIAQFGAGVDHRMGDGIMVLFNDPVPCDDPAGDAVRLAIAMRDRMEKLCKVWKRLGHRLGFGVGVSLGYATVGMVGYEGRFDYTASGTAVNLAARLCDKAEDGEILLSPRAQVAVEDEMMTEPHAELELKGISAPVEVFRLVGLKA